MLLRQLLLLCCACCAPAARAQDITGTWERLIKRYDFNAFRSTDMRYSVADITMYNDSLVRGVSGSGLTDGLHQHYTLSGVYHRADSTLYLQEDSIISYKLDGEAPQPGYYTLKLGVMQDTILFFTGKFQPFNGGRATTGLTLMKTIPVVPPKRKEAVPTVRSSTPIAPPVDVIPPVNTVARLEIDRSEKDDIRIALLDNNRIDNDVISVYLDDSLLVKRLVLAAKPHLINVKLGDRASRQIRIAVESTGGEPPCTALVVISTQTRRHEIEVSPGFTAASGIEITLKQ